MTESKAKPEFKDWLVVRLYNRDIKNAEICVLTTRRGYLLSRHSLLHLQEGIYHKGIWEKVPGLRRYKTKKRANIKAQKLNMIFNTNSYRAIREDEIGKGVDN